MRDILFRGKDIKGRWHIGLLAHIGNAWYISNKAGVSTAFEVIPDTIGQYTGLYDKKDKMIFEGDIIENPCGMKTSVEFSGGVFLPFTRSDISLFLAPDECRIVGNIYDNPELLKLNF